MSAEKNALCVRDGFSTRGERRNVVLTFRKMTG